MINYTNNKISLIFKILSQDLYKILIAIGFGLMGFAGTFLSLRLGVGQIHLYFVWSMIFPMLVNLAWGRKYGLISLFIGLSVFHPFYLWPNDGWACFGGSFSVFIWFILHGYGAEQRKQSTKYLYNIYVIEIGCLLLDAVVYFILFPFLIQYNSSFWYSNAVASYSIGTLQTFFVKRIVEDFFILFGCDVLLLLPGVKKLFHHNIEDKSKNNGTILTRTFTMCILFWFLFTLVEHLLMLEGTPQTLSPIVDSRDIIFLINLVMFCMFTGGITIRYFEKKQNAEERIKENEIKYQNVFENIIDIYCKTVLDGTIIELSPSVKRVLGYDREEVIGKNIEMLYKEPEKMKQVTESLLKEGYVENLEYQMRKKDGTIAVNLINLKVVYTEEGQINIIGIGRDVTDYVEAKKKQAEVQEEYKLIFDKMMHGIIIIEFVYDEANEVIDMIAIKANPAIEKHIGLKIADVIGKSYIKSFGGSSSNLMKMKSILNTDIPMKYELFSEKFNRYLYVNAFKVNSKQIGIMFHDNSELKHLEKKEREITAHLEAVFESTDDMIYSIDKDYRIINFNSSLKDYMKRVYNSDIENGRKILEYLPNEIADMWKSFYDDAMTKERYNFEYYIKQQGRYVEIFFNAIYHDGDRYGTAVFTKDITKKKATDQLLMKMNRDLEQLVEERTKELRSTLTELEAFTYTVSHDLKSPLRAIDGYSSIILEDYNEILNKEVKQLVINITNISRDTINLIDRVLQYSITSKARIEKEQVYINEIFINVFRELKSTCMERNILFTLETVMPVVFVDRILIRQVIYNILSNSIKFTKNKETAIIKAGCLLADKEVVFYIEDNGFGFDMKYSKKLFTMFQRFHNKDEYEGNGIGLAIVHKIVQRHGGRTWMESNKYKGTKIYFTLPIEVGD